MNRFAQVQVAVLAIAVCLKQSNFCCAYKVISFKKLNGTFAWLLK